MEELLFYELAAAVIPILALAVVAQLEPAKELLDFYTSIRWGVLFERSLFLGSVIWGEAGALLILYQGEPCPWAHFGVLVGLINATGTIVSNVLRPVLIVDWIHKDRSWPVAVFIVALVAAQIAALLIVLL